MQAARTGHSMASPGLAVDSSTMARGTSFSIAKDDDEHPADDDEAEGRGRGGSNGINWQGLLRSRSHRCDQTARLSDCFSSTD